MNRFKKTMALTAACVIAATAVNVGSVGGNDAPKVTLGNIVAAADEVTINDMNVVAPNEAEKNVIKITLTGKTIANDNIENSKSGFSITREGTNSGNTTISSVAKSGNDTIVLTLQTPIVAKEKIKVTYNPALITGESDKIKVDGTKIVATFTQSVRNQVAEEKVAAVLKSAVVADEAPNKLVLTFDKELDESGTQNVSVKGYTINGHSSALEVKKVEVQGKIVTLTLSRGVKHAEQSLKFNYASDVAAANKLQGEDGEVATIPSFNITNQVKLPELISAAVTKEEPDKLLLIFTKDLGEKGNQENTSLY